MNRWMLLAAALACLPTTAGGGVISRDWKTPGDGLLTYDDVNQREWLDLTESRLSIFPGSTLEQRYQNALLELVPGGFLEGFIAAKGADLTALAESAGIDVLSDNFASNASPTINLINLLGVSLSNLNGGLLSFGLLDELGARPPLPTELRQLGMLRVDPESGPDGQATLSIFPGNADGLATPDRTGVWLYRQVPEPAPWVLAVIGSLCVPELKRRLR